MRQHLARIGLGLALLVLLVSAVASVAVAAPQAPQATTYVVQFPYNGLNYNPKTLVIHLGDTVEWDGTFATHPLQSEDGLWPTIKSGTVFTYTFNQAGIFPYYCLAHGGPGGAGMSGSVEVMAGPIQRTFLPALLR